MSGGGVKQNFFDFWNSELTSYPHGIHQDTLMDIPELWEQIRKSGLPPVFLDEIPF